MKKRVLCLALRAAELLPSGRLVYYVYILYLQTIPRYAGEQSADQIVSVQISHSELPQPRFAATPPLPPRKEVPGQYPQLEGYVGADAC